jgi:PAS domain S-box-containing protein
MRPDDRTRSSGSIEETVERLDLSTVIEVLQAFSGETVREKLIDKLMRTAIELSGAERGVLISPQVETLHVDAEATVSGADVVVRVLERDTRVEVALPESLIRYAISTRESVILDDAATQNRFSTDPFIVQVRVRSILCLPMITQGKLVGILYFENNMSPRAFTTDRVTVLKLIASQAAISLETSRLYRDVADRDSKIRRLVDSNIIGILVGDVEGRLFEANDAFLRMLGYDREDLASGRMRWNEMTPPEWRDYSARAIREMMKTGSMKPFEKEYFHKDGSRVPVLIGYATFDKQENTGVAFVLDLTERKQADEALRESEYKLRQIVDAVPGIVWSAGPSGRLTHVNRRLLDYSGMRFDEFMHSGWEQAYMHPVDFANATEHYRHAIQTGSSYDVVLRLRRADGEFRWHRTFCEPLRDREGRIIQWYGLSIDVDEAKKAEDQLRRSEAWLAQAQRLSHTGTWVFNPATFRYSYWSDENYRIWGFDPLQGVPSREDVWRRVHPADRNRVWEEVQEAIRQKSDLTHEYRILLPDGTVKHLEAIYHMFSSLDAPGEVFITTSDVTNRKRIEQALRESETKFRDYAETASDWFWEIGPDYKFTLLIENAFASGVNRIGTTCWDYALDLETEPEKWRIFWENLDARKPFRDFIYHCSVGVNGSPMYVKASGKPVFDSNGDFCGYRGTGTDVTVIIGAQQERERLRQLETDLAHINRVSVMGELAASLSHEILHPIATARNNARAGIRFLEMNSPNLDEVREALGCVVRDADRARDIVGRMRDHIKKAPPQKERFDLNEAINEVIVLAGSTIVRNGVSTQTRLADGFFPFEGTAFNCSKFY